MQLVKDNKLLHWQLSMNGELMDEGEIPERSLTMWTINILLVT